MRDWEFGRHHVVLLVVGLVAAAAPVRGDVSGVLTFGDRDNVGFGYPAGADPTAGALLTALAPGTVSQATGSFSHGYPFAPDATDYPGTDQIYVGSQQSAAHDGYSNYGNRKPGPQTITMDYGSLVPSGPSVITGLTLGIAADDFQFPTWGQPFSAAVNGVANATLTTTLNALSETGPQCHFFTIGIDPRSLGSNHQLTLSIDEGGDGGDGWAIDFTTIGIAAAPALPGDANLDGKVAFDDLLTLAQHYGRGPVPPQAWADGDFNNDNKVGFDDLLALAQHYGQTSADPPAASPVPEPCAMLTFALAPLLLRRRHPIGVEHTRC